MAEANPPMEYLKLIPVFDGEPDSSLSVELFIHQFESVCKAAGYTENQKVLIIPSKITGKARSVLADAMGEELSYAQIKDLLVSHFSDEEYFEDTMFWESKMDPKESASAWLKRLTRMGKKLEITMSEDNFNSYVMKNFIKGLVPALKRDVLRAKPKTIGEALEAAIDSEEIEKRVNHVELAKCAIAPIQDYIPSKVSPAAAHHRSSSMDSNAKLDALSEKFDSILKVVQKLSDAEKTATKNVSHQKPLPKQSRKDSHGGGRSNNDASNYSVNYNSNDNYNNSNNHNYSVKSHQGPKSRGPGQRNRSLNF